MRVILYSQDEGSEAVGEGLQNHQLNTKKGRGCGLGFGTELTETSAK